jgi:hypothetical protein
MARLDICPRRGERENVNSVGRTRRALADRYSKILERNGRLYILDGSGNPELYLTLLLLQQAEANPRQTWK